MSAETTQSGTVRAAAGKAGSAVCCWCVDMPTCVGRYDGETEDHFCCDDHCGHGNEDGHCVRITPGSDAAVARGCCCPRMDNAYGVGFMGSPGVFVFHERCPLHGGQFARAHLVLPRNAQGSGTPEVKP